MDDGIEMTSTPKGHEDHLKDPTRRQSDASSSCGEPIKPLGENGPWYRRKWFLITAVAVIIIAVIAIAVGVSVTRNNQMCHTSCVIAPSVNVGPLNIIADLGLRMAPTPGVGSNGEVEDITKILNQIPFKVVSILPTTQSQLYAQAITIAFSKPVLPLGSNFDTVGVNVDGVVPAELKCNSFLPVKGKWRWVTTSILRFDPDGQWANNLQCSLTVNSALKAVDGSAFASTVNPVTYTSQNLQLYANGVTSASALALTDGVWSSRIGVETIDEFPQDGVLQMYTTSGATDIGLLQKALQISGPNSNGLVLNVTSCGDACAKVTMNRALDVGQTYTIFIPSGSFVQPYGGPTPSQVSVSVMGLKPFAFGKPSYQPRPSARRLRMYVRHGIRDKITIAATLLTLTTVSPAVTDLSWRVLDSTTVELYGMFQQSTQYVISIKGSPSVVDGFGLTLQDSVVVANMDDLYSYAGFPTGDIGFGGSGGNSQVFVRDAKTSLLQNQYCRGYSLNLKAVSAREIESVVSVLGEETTLDNNRVSFSEAVKSVDNPDVYRSTSVPLASILQSSGVAIMERGSNSIQTTGQSCSYVSRYLVSNGTYSLTLLQYRSTFLLWVSETMTKNVVPNVPVEIWSVKSYSSPRARLGSATTDANGMATITITSGTPSGTYLAAFATVGTNLVVTRTYYGYWSGDSTSTCNVVLHTDRSIYKPGDTVNVKGYIQQYDVKSNTMIAPSIAAGKALQTVSMWTPDNKQVVQDVTNYDGTFGSFSTTLTIPSTATYKSTSITLQGINGCSASAQVTVADPRIPTNVFDFSTTNKVLRPSDATLALKLRTATYAGSPVPNSAVTVSYDITGPNATKGSFALTTKADGTLETSQIIVGAISGTLTVKASWLTPSREILTQTVSLLVAESEWSLSIESPATNIIPTIPLAINTIVSVSASATPNVVLSKSVTLTATPVLGGSQAQCVGLVSLVNTQYKATCSITVSSMGKYTLVATTSDDSAVTIQSSALVIGKTETQWRYQPISRVLAIAAQVPNPIVPVGQTQLVVNFTNPIQGSYGRAVIWLGNQLADSLLYKYIDTVPEGSSSVVVTLPSQCNVGCMLSVVAVTYGGSAPVASIPVPMSDVEDFSTPTVSSTSVAVRIAREVPTLSVTMKTPEIVEPSSSMSIDLTLDTPVDGNSEITVMVVDKAVLDLAPRPLPSLANVLTAVDLSSGYQTYVDSVRSTYLSDSTIDKMNKNIVDRFKGQPWYSADFSKSQFHVTASNYLDGQGVDVTDFPYRYVDYMMPTRDDFSPNNSGPMVEKSALPGGAAGNAIPAAMPMASAAPSADASRNTASGATTTASAAPVIRTVFKQSPVFIQNLKVRGATTSVSVTLPDNIGTWVVKVMVATSTGKFGTATSQVVARKTLGMVSSLPRIVRFGDKFTGGVVITSFSPNPLQVKLTVSTPSALVVGTSSKDVTVNSQSPIEVLFDFTAVSYCDGCAVTFAASSTNLADGMQSTLPVLAAQEMVYIGTSFSLQAQQATNWTEGIIFPAAVPGTGRVSVAASVGRYTTVKSIGNSILSNLDDLSAPRLLEKLAPAIAMNLGYATTVSTPQEFTDASSRARQLLISYTFSDVGLMYNSQRYSYYTPYIDIYLNLNALTMSSFNPFDSSVVQMWINAVNVGVINSVQNAIQYGYSWDDFGMLAEIFYVLGASWVPSGASDAVKGYVTFDRLIQNRDKLSVEGRLVLLNILQSATTPESYRKDSAMIVSLTNSIIGNYRVTGRTAYISYDNSESHCSMRCQSLALLALPGTTFPSYLIEKIANLVAEGFPNAWWWGSQGRDVCFRLISLAAYDKRRGSSEPNLALTIKGTNQQLTMIDTTFLGADGLKKEVKANFSWADLTPKDNAVPTPLSFNAVGTGEVSVALGMSFAPALNSTKPKYFGLLVEKVTKLVRTGEVLKSPYSLAVGETVEVTLSITTKDDVTNLVVEDYLPGGLEAVDPNIQAAQAAAAASNPSSSISSSSSSRGGYGLFNFYESYLYYPWVYAFAYKEVKADRVVCVASYLWSGTHQCRYYANTVTSGSFIVPASKTYLARQPEVFGMSATEQLTVLPK